MLIDDITRDVKACPLCGENRFVFNELIWDQLAIDWGLTDLERKKINMQQGFKCETCGASLRVMNLASAFLSFFPSYDTIASYINSYHFRKIKILDLNGLGALSALLQKLPGYSRLDYPEVDMHDMKSVKKRYDFILHTDTLEHLRQPAVALRSVQGCLRSSGVQIFTIPQLSSKLTRSREGLSSSYHGNNNSKSEDLVVHYEFGADFYSFLLNAGFRDLRIKSLSGDEAIAYIIQNHGGRL